MSGRISFHEAAEREITDAVSFFQSERPDLGGAPANFLQLHFFSQFFPISGGLAE